MSFTAEQGIQELKRRGEWTPELERQLGIPATNKKESSGFNPDEGIAELKRRGEWTPGLEQELLGQKESIPQYAARTLAKGAKDAAAGVAGVGDFIASPVRLGLNLGLKAMGSKHQIGTMQEGINNGIDEMTGGYTKPRNKVESRASAIGQELAGLPAGYSLGLAAQGAKALGPMAKAAGRWIKEANAPNAVNIGGTTGGTAAVHEYMYDNEDPSTLKAIGAAALGSLVGGGTGAAVKSPKRTLEAVKDVGAKTTGKLTGWDSKAYLKQKNAGIPASLGSSSEGPLAMRAESVLYHTPRSSNVMREFYKTRDNAIKDKIGFEGKTFEEIPRSVNKESPRKAVFKLHDEKSAEQEALRKNIEPLEKKLSKEGHQVDVSDIINDLEKHSIGVHSPAQKELYENSVYGKFAKDLEKHLVGNDAKALANAMRKENWPEHLIEKKVAQIGSKNKAIPFKSLELLREQMQNKKTDSTLMTLERRQASDLYEKLRKLKDSTIEATGSKEDVANLRSANRIYSEYLSDHIDPRNGKEMGLHGYIKELKETKNDPAAFAKLASQDHNYLKAARKGMNQEQRSELATSILGDMGETPTGFNLSNMHTKMHKMIKNTKSKEEFLALYPTIDARKGFVQVMDVLGSNKKLLQSVANTSQTAHTKQYLDLIKNAAKNSGLIAKGVTGAGGTAAILAGTKGLIFMAGGLLAAKKTAKIMTDPVFLERINKVMTAKTPKAQGNFYKQLMQTPSVKAMLRNAGYNAAKEGLK